MHGELGIVTGCLIWEAAVVLGMGVRSRLGVPDVSCLPQLARAQAVERA
jgi:hypothetical protein